MDQINKGKALCELAKGDWEKLSEINRHALNLIAHRFEENRQALYIAGEVIDICCDWNAPSHVDVKIRKDWSDIIDPEHEDKWPLIRALAAKFQSLGTNYPLSEKQLIDN